MIWSVTLALLVAACGAEHDQTTTAGTSSVSAAPTVDSGSTTSSIGGQSTTSSVHVRPPEPTTTTSIAAWPTPSTVPPAAIPDTGCSAFSGFVSVGARRAWIDRPALLATTAPGWIVLHGYTGTPDSIRSTSGVTPFANSRGAVVVYPEGTAVPSIGGFQWAAGTAIYSQPGDDVPFLLALVDELVAGHCVDPARVILTGESNGAAMVVHTVCDSRAIGRVALAVPVIPAVDSGAFLNCQGTAVPLLVIASVNDDTVPYNGGEPPLLGQEAWFQQVAPLLNGCEGQASATETEGNRWLSYDACEVPTEFVGVSDGVHTWPGGPSGTGGLPPGGFDTNQAVWSRVLEPNGQNSTGVG